MTATTSKVSVSSVKRFLRARGWTSSPTAKGFESFRPPPNDPQLPERFAFFLPLEERSADDAAVVRRAVAGLAEAYGLLPEELTALIAERAIFRGSGDVSVVSTRLIGNNTTDGSISLKVFDLFLTETRRILVDSAAFAVTSAPRLDTKPPEAETFYESCRFLQTSRGSFITSIEVPSFVVQQQGFDRPEITSQAVLESLFGVISFVTTRVMKGDQTILDEDFLIANPELISYEVLRDIEQLFAKSDSEEIEFGLKSLEYTKTVNTGTLDAIKLGDLTRFVEFVKDHTTAEIEVDAIGLVVELRSSDPGSDRNYVLIRRSPDHTQDLAMYLPAALYRDAAAAHTSGRLVRVRGRASQLRTKFRMTLVEEFGVISNLPK
jgi:hypothetical protein